MTSRSDRIEFIDGPHRGLSSYPRPAPRTIMCMDSDFCYHEYQRIDPLLGVHRYRYRGRLGKPHWAVLVISAGHKLPSAVGAIPVPKSGT